MRTYSECFQFRAPQGFVPVLAKAAARHGTSASEYLRQAVLRQLAEDGIRLPADNCEGTA